MDEKLLQLYDDEFEQRVTELFDREVGQALLREPPFGRAPILETVFDPADEAAVGRLKRRICAARAASIWHRETAPPWARDLPVSESDFSKRLNELAPRQQLLQFFGYSVRAFGWVYKPHPSFPIYARGFMSYDFAPEELRNDPDLRKEFPPRPLAGLDTTLCYNTPDMVAHQRRELLRELKRRHECGGSLPPLEEFRINRDARWLACISEGD
jgi:hypothetical protein